MSSANTSADVTGDAHPHDHEHGHDPYLAHHFDTPQQQYQSAKMGMWVFLATEILMFGGLFCAYAVYRGLHPEVFLYAHHYLSWELGAINTIVLLASSFTMAWAVRASQLNQKPLLIGLLCLTLLGGFGFMVIKTIEYADKWEYKWVGASNMFYPGNEQMRQAYIASHDLHGGGHGEAHGDDHAAGHDGEHDAEKADDPHEGEAGSDDAHAHAHDHDPASGDQATDPVDPAPSPTPTSTVAAVHTDMEPVAAGPTGLMLDHGDDAHAAGHAPLEYEDLGPVEQYRTHIFFQIYFLMTGLHGLHVLVGMGLIGWVLLRAMGVGFAGSAITARNFTSVDLVGLYWHLVDLIWIFLFPLLYLIH